ncbi:MAG: hypothetical protein K1X83_09490 [Oligoflexia bacterium]|nr:hypothetical protein [Oligoflexia bacterium]
MKLEARTIINVGALTLACLAGAPKPASVPLEDAQFSRLGNDFAVNANRLGTPDFQSVVRDSLERLISHDKFEVAAGVVSSLPDSVGVVALFSIHQCSPALRQGVYETLEGVDPNRLRANISLLQALLGDEIRYSGSTVLAIPHGGRGTVAPVELNGRDSINPRFGKEWDSCYGYYADVEMDLHQLYTYRMGRMLGKLDPKFVPTSFAVIHTPLRPVLDL